MRRSSENSLITKLHAGRKLLGLYHGYPAEGVLEAMGHGWDFTWIDAQHGQFSLTSALRAVRTAAALGLETLLRAASHDAGHLGQCADTGASAVMIPQVDTLDAARSVVRALRFPPLGKRSFGGRRPIDVYGREQYLAKETTVIVQIESREAVENVHEIAACDGIDGLFFGADDMKLSFGLPMKTSVAGNELLSNARRLVAEAAGAAGKACGLSVSDPEEVRDALGLGYQLISCGSDVGFLREGSRRTLEQSRRALESGR